MKRAKVFFFQEDIRFILKDKLKYKNWIRYIAENESVRLESLNIIFCSDNFLREYNRKYMQKDYLTDVIAFNLRNKKEAVMGEIYISIDRVKDNAIEYGYSEENELKRVISHGLLHLASYKDDNPGSIKIMREKEDYYISLFDTVTKND